MLTTRDFRWLPNTLTFARIALGGVVCWAATNGKWTLGFWLFGLALSTDFFDGLAAKKLNASSKFGTQLDRLADMLVSGAAALGLALSGLYPWWAMVAAPALGIFLAEERFFRPKNGRLHTHRPAVSVGYLFSFWTYLALSYVSLAYGWHWWYLATAAVVLAVLASLKRHRLRKWLREQSTTSR